MLANSEPTIKNVRKRAERVNRRVMVACRDISGIVRRGRISEPSKP